jgi:predicted NACHT family NTPase
MTKMLYERDFYGWVQQQVHALKAKDWAALDLGNLVEEVESLARSEYRSLRSEAQRLLMQALKWRYQPNHRGDSWRHSLEQARDEIEEVLRENPSLQSRLVEAFTAGYRLARCQASRETQLPLSVFPERCPWQIDEVLTEDWLSPEG